MCHGLHTLPPLLFGKPLLNNVLAYYDLKPRGLYMCRGCNKESVKQRRSDENRQAVTTGKEERSRQGMMCLCLALAVRNWTD